MQSTFYNPFEEMANTAQRLSKGAQAMSNLPEPEVGTSPKHQVWQLDKARLFRYDRETPPTVKTPVLIAYALINRYDMMDLQPDRSLVRKLLGLGLDIYVLDTGYPTRSDRYLTMEDHILGYIGGAIDFIRQSHQIDRVNLLGVCQGGTFSTIYTAIHPEKIKNLITLVTPVDFATDEGLLFRWARDLDVDAIVEAFGGLIPGTFLDTGFQMLKPGLKANKQRRLMQIMDNEDELLNFMRMERWINNLPDHPGETYRQFIKELYQENKLTKGTFVLGQHPVKLEHITVPLLNIYASEDHLVPPAHTKPLNDLVGSKDKTLYEFPGGHIGVFTGRRSQSELGPTVFEWLKARD
ncbi:class III poly(R)-hydroxyalkanoic acid synthase subunit PhaC [Eisenibacter elegans]|jgi:polyhydroxyalkanoate synthase|uniref:class III poly(R)-hydroxyalkanoic acid synthase subunit PhaC n=1 Tax=Eisenibacter elegans TaxID=997 RepID=UPI00042697A1|nr:class III poly(R)-hydroxyalkanoic acid synthase subunit PhaC [Eisenibacter elegans]